MQKSWVMLTGMLLLGSVESPQANPLDSPDIVYIDGVPCNSACQSYMAWSRKVMPMSAPPAAQPAFRSSHAAIHGGTASRRETSKPAAHAGIAKPAAASPPKANAANSKAVEQQAPTAVAARVTTGAAPKAENAERSDRPENMPRGDAAKTAPVPANNADHLVALVVARPEIKSISDLAGKDIAIDDKHSSSSADVRTAIAAAGAAEIQLRKGQTKALNRVIRGEVPAAGLTLVYPEAAEWFPEIAGFKIFRIPLAPRYLQARLAPAASADAKSDSRSDALPAKIDASPAKAGAANSSTRTIQEQVTAAMALAENVTAASAREQQSNNADGASSDNTDRLVALLVARAEIQSVSALTGKHIAIDDRLSASNGTIRAAIAAAGATEVQLSDGPTKAIDRLIGGEVPAAVLTLVSAEAAEWFPDIKGFRVFRVALSSRSLEARLQPADNAAAKSDAPSAKIDASPAKAGAAANSSTRTIQEQVEAAMTLADNVTAASLREQKSHNTGGASPDNTDQLVALLVARAEITSVSALTGQDIAIDDRLSASNGTIRTAIAAAGATEIQLSDGPTKAINRLIGGEVQAAVLTLVSAEAAEWFPDIKGFKVFHIPLAPRSLQARLQPADNAASRSDAKSDAPPAKLADVPAKAGAAANSSTRTIREQVAAATALAEHATAATAVQPLEQKANNTDVSGHAENAAPGETQKTAAASPNADDLVALVMTRPDIKSVSDLANKDVAIEDKQSASSGTVRIAIAAAGAAAVRLSLGQTGAIERLINGEVPAAVLTLVSPEAAEWFPEIKGFRIFSVPLSPRSVKAHL